jgi:hypothetical protein
MKRHRTSLHHTPPSDAGNLRRHLEDAFRAAGLDVTDLDDARTRLLARLTGCSNDFPATVALQALNAFSAAQRADERSNADHLRTAGLSSFERMRDRT